MTKPVASPYPQEGIFHVLLTFCGSVTKITRKNPSTAYHTKYAKWSLQGEFIITCPWLRQGDGGCFREVEYREKPILVANSGLYMEVVTLQGYVPDRFDCMSNVILVDQKWVSFN